MVNPKIHFTESELRIANSNRAKKDSCKKLCKAIDKMTSTINKANQQLYGTRNN